MALSWPAVRAGALVALAFTVGTAVVVEVLDALADLDEGDPVAAVFYLLAMLGFVVGSYIAGRRAPTSPFVNGWVAMVGVYALVAIFAMVRRLVGGSDIEPLALVVNAFGASLLALLGALIAAGRNAHAGQP